ncbi:MAG: photosynthetic protein synthase I [Hyphomonas sp. BRH_c22]|uniref:SCO family protein n=1 Tax=Hyphomonas sp. BRH_c22 TaxID=1629710 RepID=UPI0005F1A216|nr:SCO family protein [Hyphomonas sp. BRH_c22]KJS37150.1 MAG: photosynthetic protein synthase I [Hyphomonas sp. BRH_c22]
MTLPYRTLAAALGVLAATACTPSDTTSAPAKARSGGAQSGCLSRSYPEIGGPISLVNDKGEAVTEDNFKGRPALIYFGFTYCPDVCPMTLVSVARAYKMLPDGLEPPQTLLISVDPERDTPETLAQYVTTAAFPENLVGLTGTKEQVRAAADSFIADYSRIDDDSSSAGYTMDHTSLLYLMDEDWKLKTFFTHEDTSETIAACLAEVLED